MQKDRKDVEAGLLNKGFKQSETDHHRFIYWTLYDKKTPVKTKTSHGSGYKTLQDGLLSEMARQCCLTKSEFFRLIDCPLTREEYEALLIEQGKI